METKDAIIFELRKEIEELKKIIIELRKEIAELRKENAELKQKNASLQEQLSLNSQNSSKPPSSDRFLPKKDKKNSNKVRPKRQGFARKWFSKEEVNQTIQYLPENVINVEETIFAPKIKSLRLVKL